MAMLLIVAAAGTAEAKPKGCLSAAELAAEDTIRHGVRLRETAQRCSKLGYSTDAPDKWKAIEAKLGSRFAAETDRRKKAFEREFPDEHTVYRAEWDGRIVNMLRSLPMTEPECEDLDRLLDDITKGGWAAFQKQAAKTLPQARMDYRTCR